MKIIERKWYRDGGMGPAYPTDAVYVAIAMTRREYHQLMRLIKANFHVEGDYQPEEQR